MHLYARRSAAAQFLALAAALASCAGRYTPRRPLPITVENRAPALAVSGCEPAPERAAPTAGTPAPGAEGALSVLEVRGDDRMNVRGYYAVAWAPDGERVVTATRTHVLVWRAGTGALERAIALPTPFESPGRLALSADGAWAAVTGTVRAPGASDVAPGLWLVRTSGALASRYVPGVAGELRFGDDGRELVGLGGRWDVATGVRRADAPVAGTDARALPDGRRYLTFAREPAAAPQARYRPELRDARTGALLRRFEAVDTPRGAAVSGDGRRIAVLDGALSVYASDTFERVAHVPDAGGARSVSLSFDGALAALDGFMCAEFLSGSGKGGRGGGGCRPPVLSLWDLARGARVWSSTEFAGSQWDFTRDGRFLTGPDTRLVEELLRVEDGAPVRVGGRIRAISPDGRWALYDPGSGPAIASLAGEPPPWTRMDPPALLALSPSGARAVRAGDGGALRLESGGRCVSVAGARAGSDGGLAFTPDESLLVVVRRGAQEGFVHALDASDGTARWSMRLGGRGAQDARVFVTGGQVLVQGTDHDDVRRFDARTGAALPTAYAPRARYHTPPEGGGTYEVRDRDGDRVDHLNAPAAALDGSALASVRDFGPVYAISLWDLADPRGVVDLRAGGWPSRVALSPDESRWAVALRGGRVRWLSRDARRWVDGAASHGGDVTAVAFTPAGDRMVSAGEDGSVLVFEPSTGRVLGRARLPLDHALFLAIPPAGGEVIAETARGMRVRFRLAR